MRLILLLTLLLAACGSRAVLDVQPGPAIGDISRVHVATIRAADDDGSFGRDRAEALSYLSLDISVPPDRAPGEMTYRKRGRLDPARQFYATDRFDYADDAAFRRELTSELARQGEREVIIYVHGFNNTFADGVYRLAQLSHDFGFEGVAVHYSWPSAASALGYEYDRDSGLIARDGLQELIETVYAAGQPRILVVAHSMGALLTMEVLRQMEIGSPGSVLRAIDGVILMSPDIDIEVFRSQAKRIGTLPEPFAIFVSRRDRALLLSAFLTGKRQRLGNIYSTEALADLKVTVFDITQIASGGDHFAAGTSPLLIRLMSRAAELDAALRGGAAGRIGLLPGLIITVQSATELVLSPIGALAR